jgi:putative colanic acid biosynthesis UDP-glucose lipid carrier transferase
MDEHDDITKPLPSQPKLFRERKPLLKTKQGVAPIATRIPGKQPEAGSPHPANYKIASRHKPVGRFVRFVADLVLLNLLFHVTLALRFGVLFPVSSERLHGAPWSIYPELEFFMNLLWIVISVSLKLYTPSPESDNRFSGNLEEIRAAARAGLLLAGSVLLCIVARGGYNFYSRLFLGYFLAAIPVALVFFRIIVQSTAASVRHQKAPRKNVLIIGAGANGESFYKTVSAHPEYGYRVLGFLDNNGLDSKVRPMILGRIPDLDRVASRATVDEVIIALPATDEASIAALVTECENRCIRVALISNEYPVIDRPRTIEQVGEFSLVRMREAPLDLWSNRLLKRVFDIAFSLVVLMLIFPIVFLASALAIKFTSRGPIFFKQPRTGEDGRTFLCYKFRTMRNNRLSANSIQATQDDPRPTRVGRLLRRTSLDELPQFWNVLKGEMSVAGPRPHMLKHTEDYRNVISQYMVRHFVKPGVTGWAQVNGYRGATLDQESMQRRIEHDLYYIEHWSFLLDLTIIARTAVRVLRGDENAY